MAGLFLLGAPAMVLTVSGSMAWMVAVCLVRGLGFALTIVAGGALTASLIRPSGGARAWRWWEWSPRFRR